MTSVNLEDLHFGAPAAEREDNLADYFLESESYKRLRDGKKYIALGNRGSGKTAIFRMLAEHARQEGRLVRELAPEDFSYQLLSETLKGEAEGSWVKQSGYTAGWKYILYVLAMKEVADAGRKIKRGATRDIYKYLRDNHANIDKNPIGALVSYLKRMEGIKIGKYEAGAKARELQKLYKLEEIDALLEPLAEATQDRPVLFLVDELDRGWDASEDAKAFVAGLFNAALTINNEAPNIRVLLALRRELYENIPALYEDAQKIRDIMEIIEWEEESLLRLISKRIGASFGELEDMDDQERWDQIFAPVLDYRQTKSFNYMVDRTLYRPREIIQFCDTCREVAIDNDIEAPIDYTTISEAELSYSEGRVKDIAAEYSFQYPGLESIFETFRSMPYSLTREGLEFHCMRIEIEGLYSDEAAGWCENIDPESLIQILWGVGFLRAQAIGGLKGRRRSGSSYLGPHQIGSLSLTNINRFQVHQMFRDYLGMKEGTYEE